VDEKPTDSFLYTLAMNTLTMSNSMNPFDNTLSNDKLFAKQAEVIKELAENSCIIVGRCGGYILREDEACIKVFVCADRNFRKARIAEKEGIDMKDASKRITQMDKRRSSYFGYYAGQDWLACNTYDLSVSTSAVGVDKAVEMIEEYIKIRFEE